MNKKRVAFSTAGVLAGVSAGALLGVANYFYKSGLTPRTDFEEDEDSSTATENYKSGRRWMNEHVRRKDIFLMSQDGLQLHANYIKASDPDCHRYAICVHGWRDSAESVGVYARRYYEEYGMSVLLPDLRGHGASEGGYIGMGYRDGQDINQWARAIVTMDPKAVIILHGISMGAATVLLAGGGDLPEEVKAVISDSAYTSAMEEFYYQYRCLPRQQRVLPAAIVLPLVRGVCMTRARYDLAKASPEEAVRVAKAPTLFIHGDADDFVPSSMMPRLYEAAACRKDFLWIHGAGHVASVTINPVKYWSKIEEFLGDLSPFILHENYQDADPFVDSY